MNTNEPTPKKESELMQDIESGVGTHPLERWGIVAGATFLLICTQLLIGSAHVSRQMNGMNFNIDMNHTSPTATFVYGALLSGIGILVSIGTFATITYGAFVLVRFIAGRPLIDLFTR